MVSRETQVLSFLHNKYIDRFARPIYYYDEPDMRVGRTILRTNICQTWNT